MVVERGGIRHPRTDRCVRPRDPEAPCVDVARRLLPRRDGAPPGGQRDADSHARHALPLDDAPAPERRARRVGSAPRRPRDTSCTRSRDRSARLRSGVHASGGRSSAVARELHGLAPPLDLRRGAREPEQRCSTSSTRPTSPPGSRCGGASSRTSRTAWARARGRPTCSRHSSSRVRSGSSWRSSRTRSTTSTSTRITACGGSTRSRISSSRGMLMAVEQAVVFFAVFAYWFFRFLAGGGAARGR